MLSGNMPIWAAIETVHNCQKKSIILNVGFHIEYILGLLTIRLRFFLASALESFGN